jgi:hypothetical protein
VGRKLGGAAAKAGGGFVRLLMPLALEKAAVDLVEPDGRGGLTFLAESIDGDDPVPRSVPARCVAKGRRRQRLLGNADDLPRALELIDVIAGDASLAAGVPL